MKLKLTHVEGVYVIWIGGLLIATIGFLIELIVYKTAVKRNKNKLALDVSE